MVIDKLNFFSLSLSLCSKFGASFLSLCVCVCFLYLLSSLLFIDFHSIPLCICVWIVCFDLVNMQTENKIVCTKTKTNKLILNEKNFFFSLSLFFHENFISIDQVSLFVLFIFIFLLISKCYMFSRNIPKFHFYQH